VCIGNTEEEQTLTLASATATFALHHTEMLHCGRKMFVS